MDEMLIVYRLCSKCKVGEVYRKNASWCKECFKLYARTRRASNPDYTRERNLVSRYGLTLEMYDKKLESQGGVCGSCRRPPEEDEIFHVDHDHNCCPRSSRKTCGKCVRDLLCISCNMIVGKLEKNVFAPQISYIEKWNFQ